MALLFQHPKAESTMFAVKSVVYRTRGLVLSVALLGFLVFHPALSAPAEFADAAASGGKASLTLTTSRLAATEDAGKLLHVFMVAVVPQAGGDAVFARTKQQWVRIDSFAVPELQSIVGSPNREPLPVSNDLDVRSMPGTTVFLGYGLDGSGAATAFDEMIVAKRYRLIYTIAPGSGDTGAAAP